MLLELEASVVWIADHYSALQSKNNHFYFYSRIYLSRHNRHSQAAEKANNQRQYYSEYPCTNFLYQSVLVHFLSYYAITICIIKIVMWYTTWSYSSTHAHLLDIIDINKRHYHKLWVTKNSTIIVLYDININISWTYPQTTLWTDYKWIQFYL